MQDDGWGEDDGYNEFPAPCTLYVLHPVPRTYKTQATNTD